MKIFIAPDYKCHVLNDGTMREFNISEFDGKCTRYIEGYRYVPEGETWTREDGVVFSGEMLSPWRPYEILEAYQAQYEESKSTIEKMSDELADRTAALELLEVEDL